MKRLLFLLLSAVLLTSAMVGCSARPSPVSSSVSSDPSSSSFDPVSDTTSALEYFNEKGPFDAEHYNLGLRALQAIDSYLDGYTTIAGVNKVLADCYEEVSALPELPESDPFYAGNDFVYSYIFLAYVDYQYQLSGFATKKYQDRNLLAAALGEPENDYSDILKVSPVDAYLDDVISKLEAEQTDVSVSYYWYEGDLFIDLNTTGLNYFYENRDSLSAETKENLREVSHGYVSGDFAKILYNEIRKVGGDDFLIYISLKGITTFCVSCNLEIILDYLNE